MMNEEAKVVKVIDDFRVVINKGMNDGVSEGLKFLIYEAGEELFDPDTAESLGRLEVVKGQGKAHHVQEKLSVIRSSEFTSVRTPTLLGAAFSNEVHEEKRKPFDDPQIGDLARVVSDKRK